MVWKQVAIETNEDGVDLVSSVLLDAGAGGVQIDGGKMDVPRQDEYLAPSFEAPAHTYVKAYFSDNGFENTVAYLRGRIEALKSVTENDIGPLLISISDVPDTDWNANFKKHFKTFRAAGNIVIKPTWEAYIRKDGDIVIEMDPGQAFGSGTHETTKMCLEMVQRYMKGGASVIDVGCGSGILGIACAKMGAGHVLSLDNDIVSVDVTRSNALDNGIRNLEAHRSDLLQNASDGHYDIVLANIIADVIIRLNSDAPRVMAPDAIYIMSGIISDRLDDVLASLDYNGFDVIETQRMGDWCAVAARGHDA